MYPDFLASPELALECFRQETHIRGRQTERQRLARNALAPQRSGLTIVLSVVKAMLYRSYLRLKPKPELASLTASSR